MCRTVGTRLSGLGFNRPIFDKVLNPEDTTVGGIYDRHSCDREKRQALSAGTVRLAEIVSGARADVVALRGGLG